jgi:hypothetical protein
LDIVVFHPNELSHYCLLPEFEGDRFIGLECNKDVQDDIGVAWDK